MPKLWTETIDAHRRAVRDAILDTTAALVGREGLRAVTMSRIAEETGIGRATLYKYFPDVEAILAVWHREQIARHLDQLAAVRDQGGSPIERLEAVLGVYARLSRQSRDHHDSELAALLHRDPQVAAAHRSVHDMVRELVTDAVAAGEVRDDIAPHELTTYCLHALTAAGSLPSKAALDRLVTVTLAGLRRRS
jgi:AcrR family transcriptional regulator